MQPDSARVEETRAWLARVRTDLRAAEIDLSAAPPLTDDAVFHCQQAIEKVLKSFLTWHDKPFSKTHNLGELGLQCCEVDAGLSELLERATVLTEYATVFRYPGLALVPDDAEAHEALVLARQVVSAVLDRLPEEIRA